MGKKWWGRKDEPDDVVQIGDDSGHGWWAGRDQLDRSIDRRWRRGQPGGEYPFRRATDDPGAHLRVAEPAAASSATYLSPSDLPRVEGTVGGHDPWDPSTLFSATPPPESTGADSWTGRRPPWFGESDESSAVGTDAEPWCHLALTSEASWDEVVQRHRQLVKEHHPDRHGGAPESARRAAEDRMAAINAAFNDLAEIYRLTENR